MRCEIDPRRLASLEFTCSTWLHASDSSWQNVVLVLASWSCDHDQIICWFTGAYCWFSMWPVLLLTCPVQGKSDPWCFQSCEPMLWICAKHLMFNTQHAAATRKELKKYLPKGRTTCMSLFVKIVNLNNSICPKSTARISENKNKSLRITYMGQMINVCLGLS